MLVVAYKAMDAVFSSEAWKKAGIISKKSKERRKSVSVSR
jgi:hypothetical protein